MDRKAALYLRVSTARQAEKELSIPDQRRQAEDYCRRKGWSAVVEYVEPGASATDDKRPAFQRMIDEASWSAIPFDTVIVHSFSRFFRDAYQFEFYRRKLARHGVEVVSITQELGDDPMGDMVRQILNLFDEYQSKENAKHVLRAMKENARQGYWNGARPPYGYKAEPVEVRAEVTKKKLAIEPNEAEVVQQAFALYLSGKGIRAIVDNFNGRGSRHRKGKRFQVSVVHAMLTNRAYMGIHHFNKRCSRSGNPKDPSEWVAFDTPVIIAPETFEKVQDLLARRRPSNTPPRVVNGPTLLTGIAKCGTCGGGMTLRTGKGGSYRYYSCNNRVTKGADACTGRNIRMDLLDELVLTELEGHLFQPERLSALLEELIRRNAEKADELHKEEVRLRKALRVADEKIDRLMDAVAEGLIGGTEGFKRKLSDLEQQREDLLRQVSTRKRRRELPTKALSIQNLERFASAARRKLREGNNAFRKRYLNLFVDKVEVGDDAIRISGSKASLVAAAQTTKPDTSEVPSYVQEWWARLDSNQQPDRYERPALTN